MMRLRRKLILNILFFVNVNNDLIIITEENLKFYSFSI